MTLEAAFQNLDAHLARLGEVFGELVLTMGDKPLCGDYALVQKFADTIEDVRGWMEDALTAAREGEQAVRPPIQMDRAIRALATVQRNYNRLTHLFATELVSYPRLDQLTQLGREHGGEWLAWVRSLKEGLERCQPLLYDVNQSLFECWFEFAERAGMNSISVQATNIGQQITGPEAKELERDGIP